VLKTSTAGSLDPTPLREYVTVLARRKGLFMLVLLAVPTLAVLVSLQGGSLYEARSQVLLSDRDLAGTLAGVQGGGQVDLDRVVDTQARIARTPELARRVLRSAGLGSKSANELLSASDVAPVGGTNVLEFGVVDADPGRAERLATAYAQQFVRYTRALDTTAIERARSGIAAELSRLARQGGRNSELYARLAEEAQTLRTMAALQTSRAQLLREAEGAEKIAPRPARAGAFGLVAGVMLAIGLIAVLEALDSRVRSETDVADSLGIPLLGRLSEPPRRLRRNSGLAVLAEPDGADAEAFRILRANLDYANSHVGAKTIMFTSCVRGEGKSTTASNLAASFARLGKRVVLVDLDFRRPSVRLNFGLSDSLGMSDVVMGLVLLEQALVKVPIATPSAISHATRPRRWAGSSSASHRKTSSGVVGAAATLEVLLTGTMPVDVGEFVGASGVADVLRSLSERAEIVFIDAPPVLEVSDPMTLMKEVDALVVVARLGVVRYPMLKDLRRTLDASAASALGVVITGVDASEGYGPYNQYGYSADTEDQRGQSALHVVNESSQHYPTTS